MSDTHDQKEPEGLPPSIFNYRPLSERPGYEAESRTFTDPEQPGWWVRLTVRPLFGGKRADAALLASELRRAHVSGLVDAEGNLLLDEKKQPVQQPEAVFTRYGNVTPSDSDCSAYANLVSMWAGAGPPPPLSEFLGWKEATDTAWLEILGWIGSILDRPRRIREGDATASGIDLGNSPGGPTGTGSPGSSGTPAGTQNSSNEKTPTSAPSNGPAGSRSDSCGGWPEGYDPSKSAYAFLDAPVPPAGFAASEASAPDSSTGSSESAPSRSDSPSPMKDPVPVPA